MSGNPTRPSCTLLLVRHAHTEMAGRFCGASDPPLSDQGIAQLAGLNERLAAYPVTHIFSSGLQRARQTAESIAQCRGLKVQYLDFLHELAFGSWEGLDWDQVVARDPAYAQHWLDNYPSVPAPGGEYFEDFCKRVQRAMSAIAAQAEGGCAAVVTHGGVIRTFLGSLPGSQNAQFDPRECDYVSCWEVSWDGEQWTFLGRIATPQAASGAMLEHAQRQ
jgi:broad specificity phosphatase PhoE